LCYIAKKGGEGGHGKKFSSKQLFVPSFPEGWGGGVKNHPMTPLLATLLLYKF